MLINTRQLIKAVRAGGRVDALAPVTRAVFGRDVTEFY